MPTDGATVRRSSTRASAYSSRPWFHAIALLAASLIAACLCAGPAEAHHRGHARHVARGHHRYYSYYSPRRFAYARHARSLRHAHFAPVDAPGRNFAAIVVDGNSGRTLYARNEDEPRHPASITKVMTLYLLFEQLDRGRLSLDSELRVSDHAAAQKPTKLGLRPGATIRVEDAIEAVVTRSANDMAVAIAEAIGGDERHFADLMTLKAHELGMSGTRFVNASGLPDDAQITTARDLSILGRAVQERFPRYYHYFSTRVFHYAGATIPNHNHLLDRIEGMDGIKTGYTRASGFNLLTSVKRDGHYIVAVVMGGVSAASRDRTMTQLVEDKIDDGATVRTASAMPDAPTDLPPRPRMDARLAAAADLPVRLETWREPREASRPVPAHALAAAEAELGNSAPAPKAQPAQRVRVASIGADVPVGKVKSAAAAAALEDSEPPATDATSSISPPSPMRRPGRAADRTAADRPIEKAALRAEPEPVDRVEGESAHRPAATHTGWMIQIGATEDVAKANALLAKAKANGRGTLAAAQPFTEKVQKGPATLYRARFAGLESDSAELACRTLKRTGFSCFATKN